MQFIKMQMLRPALRFIGKILFRVKVEGIENYHKAGPRVLIIANHVSFIDGALLAIFLPQIPVFVINTYMARHWWVKIFIRMVDYTTIDPANPLYVKSLIKVIANNKPVVIFPEGRITVTGALMKIYQGPALVADKCDADILPIYLDGPQYTRFSRLKGIIRQRWFPPLRISIQPPRKLQLDAGVKGAQRRQQLVQQLSDMMRDMVLQGADRNKTLIEAVLGARAVHGGGHIVLEDTNRRPLSYNGLLRAMLAIAARLKLLLPPQQQNVALMLPNTVAVVVAFLSLHWLAKTPVMLNYTAGLKSINSAVNTAGVKQLITSRQFIQAVGLQPVIDGLHKSIEVLYLEDIRRDLTLPDKLGALLLSWMPNFVLRTRYAGARIDDAAVILFTSGSEGQPKGVVLSHGNLITNYRQIAAVINFTPADTILNALPLFHSFGLTTGIVLTLLSGVRLFLYPSPLHYNVIPELFYDIRATIMFGSGTFLEGYARKAHPYDFSNARLIVAGAEKLQEHTRKLWLEKFGVRVLEGYGATEASPVVSVNTPTYHRRGSVGRLLPGMQYHIEPMEGITEGGRLQLKGPNIMQGYLMPDAPEVLQPPTTEMGEGWHDVGDIAAVDDLQYITILGRAKRFAKIAGEMVSLAVVEQLARTCWNDAEHAAISRPDDRKGEKLVLFTTVPEPDKKQLLHSARQQGISELAIPQQIVAIDAIPLLGSGKVDYNALQSYEA